MTKSLAEEKAKLSKINSSKADDITAVQQEFHELQQRITELAKERDFIKQKQTKFRSDLEVLNNREEFLQKERNATKIMESRLKNQLDEIVEAAKLHKTIEQVDLNRSESLI